jgi:hypothetical protein
VTQGHTVKNPSGGNRETQAKQGDRYGFNDLDARSNHSTIGMSLGVFWHYVDWLTGMQR